MQSNSIRVFFLILFFFCGGLVTYAQQLDETDLLKKIHGFKTANYPDDGKSIVQQVIGKEDERKKAGTSFIQYNQYNKTDLSVLANEDSIQGQINKGRLDNGYVFRKIFLPFESLLVYAKPGERPGELELTALLSESYQSVTESYPQKDTHNHLLASRFAGFYQMLGEQNAEDILNQLFGEIDLCREESQLMLLSFKSPLASDALDMYRYHLVGTRTINGIDCTEIAFYSVSPTTNAFAGYLYITTDGRFSLQQVVFTLNDPERMNFIQNLLITHVYTQVDSLTVPLQKKTHIVLGDPHKGRVSATHLTIYNQYNTQIQANNMLRKNTVEKTYATRDSLYWNSIRPVPLSASQTQVDALVTEAKRKQLFVLFQETILTLITNHVTVGGLNGSVEFGPLSQFFSYNDMEGVRLKIGGNTNINLMNHFQVGGYLAYGTKDTRFKYRGDLIYSLLPRKKYIWEYPKRLFTFSYVKDLNIPGQDLLTTTRDNIFNSFSSSPTDNMSLQKIGVVSYEQEIGRQFAYKVSGKYTYDQPLGVVQYIQTNGTDTSVVSSISTSEVQFQITYTPGESFIQNRDKRIIIRRADVELKLNHRIGIKGVLGSDYNFQITNFSAHKKITFNKHIGTLDIRASGGKVWNRVPFPLLFIPVGNQSYLFHPDDYNSMHFYEFATDRFIAGNMNFLFNWSPVNWFNKNSKIQMSVGGRILYGPLSNNNNPNLHPELFTFNQGVKPLGKTPYAELNIGLANLFKILRVEYVRRLTYLSSDVDDGGKQIFKGSLLINASFAF